MTSLATLLAEREIVAQLNRFARMLDAKDWDAADSIFASDVVSNYGPLSGGEKPGLEPIVAGFRKHLDACGATQHLLGTIDVAVDGDSAVSRAYVQARHSGIGALAGQHFDANGEYRDSWTLFPEGWRIVRREATWAAHLGNPAVIGL